MGADNTKLNGAVWFLLLRALLELLLPAEHAGAVGFLFGFGDHPFFLVEDREAGVGKHVIGVERGQLLRNGDGLVIAVQVLVDACQAVERVGVLEDVGIGREVWIPVRTSELCR